MSKNTFSVFHACSLPTRQTQLQVLQSHVGRESQGEPHSLPVYIICNSSGLKFRYYASTLAFICGGVRLQYDFPKIDWVKHLRTSASGYAVEWTLQYHSDSSHSEAICTFKSYLSAPITDFHHFMTKMPLNSKELFGILGGKPWIMVLCGLWFFI